MKFSLILAILALAASVVMMATGENKDIAWLGAIIALGFVAVTFAIDELKSKN